MKQGLFNDDKIKIINAEPGNYLVIKDEKNSEKLIGRPIRIIFDNSAKTPEFEEKKDI